MKEVNKKEISFDRNDVVAIIRNHLHDSKTIDQHKFKLIKVNWITDKKDSYVHLVFEEGNA